MKPLVAALKGQKPTRRPLWFMRQAGRYLPEYREVRAKISFTDLCRDPHWASEVTLQPLRRYDLDAAIIFSDILIPAAAMGQNFTLDKGEGPHLSPPVRAAKDLKNLVLANAERDLGFVGDAIAKTKAAMAPHQAMIGFAGAPFTVASYMIEGEGSKTFTEVKKLLYRDRAVFDGLLRHIAAVTLDYLKMQVKAGADALMLFDTWAANLASDDYQSAVWPVTRQLLKDARQQGAPVIYFPGQGSDRLAELDGAEVDAISVDWRTPLERAGSLLKQLGLDVTLQGNLDPQTLLGSEELVRSKTRAIIAAGSRSARQHVFNVGHGLLPHTPPEALHWVIDEVHRA